MVSQIRDIEFIATETEAEALLAEQEFIKRYRPVFNVRLRDDKSYPYIGISLDEDYPRIYFTRERHRRNRAYFGPFSNAKRVRVSATSRRRSTARTSTRSSASSRAATARSKRRSTRA